MRKYDVVAICNALVDILVEADEADIKELGLRKGAMHLVDAARQKEVLAYLERTHHKRPKTTVELGGSAMNAVRTLARLGMNTSFAGMVAADSYGTLVRERLSTLKIDAKLGDSAHEPTGTCLILITPDGERTMNTHLGASRLYALDQVPREQIATSRLMHFCGYQWDTDGQKAAILAAIKHAKDNNTKISFDVADPFVVERHRDEFRNFIQEHADVVFANREEAKLLYGSVDETAEQIARTGAVAAIKLGAEGALIRFGVHAEKVAPVPTKVVDTTAAGDMFAAGFLFGYVQERPLKDCGRYAATLASDVISRVGAVVSETAIKAVKES
jgi:sugar/nucleoside kinase (ribokinase family)